MIRKLGTEKPKTKNDYHRPQDTWLDQSLSCGDVETDGPCRRVRSLRSRRTIFTLAVTAFTIGALLIIGTSPYKNDFLAPGPLCSSHAQILAGQGADRCAACHGASDKTLASWLTDTLTGGRTIPVSQSELCMKCHENSISPDFALNPHSIASSDLQDRTEEFKRASSTSSSKVLQSLTSAMTGSHSEIACSACHREHHGAASLTAVTDQQCQSCHAQSFDSFEGSHPEFTNWPQQRRSRIAFDHSTHAMKHFPGKSTEFNCNQCHVDGPLGNVKLLASFEQSCAACHDQQIHLSGESGFAIFSLPSVDPEAMEDQDLKIGSWPLAATGDFDGRIPPAMRLLLQADPAARKVLEQWNKKFGAAVDFADVDPDVANDVAQAAELVWAIKRLLYELATDGRESLRTRLSQALDGDVSRDQVELLASELDTNVFRNTVRRWLPDLQAEIAQHDVHGLSRLNGRAIKGGRVGSSSRSYLPVKFSKVVQADDGLLVANPLKGLLSGVKLANQAEQKNSSSQIELEDAGSESLSVNQQVEAPSNASSDHKKKTQLTVRKQLTGEVSSDAELLAVNPLAAGVSGGTLSLADSVNSLDEKRAGLGLGGTKSSDQATGLAWKPPGVTRAGWYRDDELFRVFYRPGGHEDPCVKAWSDLVSSVAAANARPELQPLFEQLLSDTGIGKCASCHTVDQHADASFVVNWSPEYRDPSIGAFTKFSHQPHTLQPHLRDCSACHDMSQPVSNKDSFMSHDSSEMVSNFAPITKLNCVNCHRQGVTDSGCTHCHSYHVGLDSLDGGNKKQTHK